MYLALDFRFCGEGDNIVYLREQLHTVIGFFSQDLWHSTRQITGRQWAFLTFRHMKLNQPNHSKGRKHLRDRMLCDLESKEIVVLQKSKLHICKQCAAEKLSAEDFSRQLFDLEQTRKKVNKTFKHFRCSLPQESGK